MAKGKLALMAATVYSHLAAFHLPYIHLLRDLGFTVHALGSGVQGRDLVEQAGAKCWEAPFSRAPASRTNLVALRTIEALLREHRYDLIHVHTPVASFVVRLAARRVGIRPVLYTAHGFHFFRSAPLRNWCLYYPAEWAAARWTDALITMTEEDFGYASALPVRGTVFRVNGVGVDVKRYGAVEPGTRQKLRLDLQIPLDAPVVLCVAELIKRKNHEQLLAACDEVSQWLPSIHLLLVGDGPLRDHLESSARDMKAKVRFLGFRRDIPELLAASDVLALTSLHEGLPRCVMEAMAAGKPVVATDVRGNRDLLQSGGGFLVPVGNSPATAQKLARLLSDPEMATQVGEVGRARIQAYDLGYVLPQYERIYRAYA